MKNLKEDYHKIMDLCRTNISPHDFLVINSALCLNNIGIDAIERIRLFSIKGWGVNMRVVLKTTDVFEFEDSVLV